MDRPSTHRIGTYTLQTLLTRGNTHRRADAQYAYTADMRLMPRDYRVLNMVSRFSQLSTPQINALVFHDCSTRTPCDRALKRLITAGLLDFVPQPRGGKRPNVYQLGREAWPMFYTGRRKIQNVLSFHKLTVADVFVQVHNAVQEGRLNLLEWQIEHDAWAVVAGIDVRPDAYLRVGEESNPLHLWLEVDLGGERRKQLIDKLEVYAYAYANRSEWDFYKQYNAFPQVIYLVPNNDRQQELNRIISHSPDLPEGLVTVQLIEQFPQTLQ